MVTTSPLTPTEKKILRLLSDGLPHHPKEIFECLWDEYSQLTQVRSHLYCLRKKLPRGKAILCEFRGRKYYYRLVQLVGIARMTQASLPAD